MKIRHGDVVIEEVNEIPQEANFVKERKELAFGEVTGHAHRVDVGELFETKNGQLYLRVKELSNLTHEEHGTVKLKPGCYKVSIKQQYVPGWMTERVAD